MKISVEEFSAVLITFNDQINYFSYDITAFPIFDKPFISIIYYVRVLWINRFFDFIKKKGKKY